VQIIVNIPPNIKFREKWSKGRRADIRGQTRMDGQTWRIY